MQRAITPSAPSIAAASVSTAPAANALLAQLGGFTAAQAGQYYLTYKWLLTGTAEVALSNLQLVVNSAPIITLPTISGSGWAEADVYAEIPAGQFCYFKVVANATAGAVYSAQIVATMLSPIVN